MRPNSTKKDLAAEHKKLMNAWIRKKGNKITKCQVGASGQEDFIYTKRGRGINIVNEV